MGHTVSILVANKSGVLVRVASLFSRRGYNIESLSVGTTDDPEISRITVVVKGDEQILEQVTKQLNKLIDTYKVSDITNDPSVDRNLAMIKVKAGLDTRSEIMQIADVFRGKVVDVAPKSLVIEITGDEGKINAIEEMLRPFGIIELVRTGKIAMVRGNI